MASRGGVPAPEAVLWKPTSESPNRDPSLRRRERHSRHASGARVAQVEKSGTRRRGGTGLGRKHAGVLAPEKRFPSETAVASLEKSEQDSEGANSNLGVPLKLRVNKDSGGQRGTAAAAPQYFRSCSALKISSCRKRVPTPGDSDTQGDDESHERMKMKLEETVI